MYAYVGWHIRFITQTLSILLGLLFCSVKIDVLHCNKIYNVMQTYDLIRITIVFQLFFFSARDQPSFVILYFIAFGNNEKRY